MLSQWLQTTNQLQKSTQFSNLDVKTEIPSSRTSQPEEELSTPALPTRDSKYSRSSKVSNLAYLALENQTLTTNILGVIFFQCQLLSKESSTVLYQASPRRIVSTQTLNMQAALGTALTHSSKSNNEHAVVNLVWTRPCEDKAICVMTATHVPGAACNVPPSLKTPAQTHICEAHACLQQ